MTKMVAVTFLCALLYVPAGANAAAVYAVHAIPGANGLPVDILVNGALCAVQGLTYGDVRGPLSVPGGTYTVEIKPADSIQPCSQPTLLTASAPVGESESASIVAHLKEDGTPSISKFANDTSRTEPGKGRVAVYHLAAAPKVDVSLRRWPFAGQQSVTVPNVGNGDSAAAEFRPGELPVILYAAGTRDAVYSDGLMVKPFTLTLVYAAGRLDNGSFMLIRKTVPAF